MPEAVARAVIERSEDISGWPSCEFMIPGVCNYMGEQLHHRLLRSQGGQHTVTCLVYICSDCHDAVHGLGKESYENGWLVHGWDDPEDEPVLRRGRWVLLHEDGTMTEVERDQSDTRAETGG